MADCPPGKIRNPQTSRCVKVGGRAPGLVPAEVAGGGGAGSLFAPPRPVVATTKGCREGTQRNPATGRCIKIGGPTYKRLFPGPEVRTAVIAPLGAPATVRAWIAENCRNDIDPLTQQRFRDIDASSLLEVVRLHNRTCTLATPLHSHVVSAHQANKVATVPGDPTDEMTLPNFQVLRDAKRRTDPTYKLPPRRHAPPPPNWQFYLSQDNRSGPDFASVMYVDANKIVRSATGIEIPVSAVKVDFGFIPADVPPGALCSGPTIVELLDRLARAGLLLKPVVGGWTPIAGFPFTKQYWAENRIEKIGQLCRELVRTLTRPL